MKKFMTALVAVFAMAVLLAEPADVQAAATFNTIEKGVFIGDMDVSGMTTLEAEEAVVDMIFMEQSGKRFAIIGLSAVAALFAEEDAAERPKEQRAHDEENKSDGREIEEG